jgi:hypothetical protein
MEDRPPLSNSVVVLPHRAMQACTACCPVVSAPVIAAQDALLMQPAVHSSAGLHLVPSGQDGAELPASL